MPESQAAHEADAARCPICRTSYGKGHPRPHPFLQPRQVPLVAGRSPAGPDEVADGAGQLVSTGRLAIANGWQVYDVTYAMTIDGTEVSALHLTRGDLRAVATWERKSGGSWSADVAYGWQHLTPGTMTKLGVQRLRAVIKAVGEQK